MWRKLPHYLVEVARLCRQVLQSTLGRGVWSEDYVRSGLRYEYDMTRLSPIRKMQAWEDGWLGGPYIYRARERELTSRICGLISWSHGQGRSQPGRKKRKIPIGADCIIVRLLGSGLRTKKRTRDDNCKRKHTNRQYPNEDTGWIRWYECSNRGGIWSLSKSTDRCSLKWILRKALTWTSV
jgi:hypothetical protein